MEGGVIVFHRIKDIMSLKKYVLLATFQDGTVKTYDVSSLFEEVEAFNAWDNGVLLCEDNGVK